MPLVLGATNENLYVPSAPLGGGVTATTSSGVSTGNGTSVFIPLIAFTGPPENAALNDVRARVPSTTIVTSFVDPACTVEGTVIVRFGTGVVAAWHVESHVWD